MDIRRLGKALLITSAVFCILDGLTLWAFSIIYGSGAMSWELNPVMAWFGDFGLTGIMFTRALYLTVLMAVWPCISALPRLALGVSALVVIIFGFATFSNIMAIMVVL